MANRPLKSVVFPGLEGTTYTIPYAVNASGTTQTASTAVASSAWVTSLPTIHHGTTVPTSSLGKNGDIYIMHT